MLDDLERLRNNHQVLQLFRHYAKLSEANPEVWHVRLTQLECDGRVDPVKLHGELIAFDLIEQNTGQMPCSYRLTRAGLRALQQFQKSMEVEPRTHELMNQAA